MPDGSSNITTQPTIAELAIRTEVDAIAAALMRLIPFMQGRRIHKGTEIWTHPVWGKLIPFHIEGYGKGASLGHCIGLDLVISDDGSVRVTEFDFGPSGRGYVLASLPEEQGEEVVATFAAWYRSMRAPNLPDQELGYYYTTGPRTTCFKETEYFCARVRKHGIVIDPANIDALVATGQIDRVVDRLFYRSEADFDRLPPRTRVITKEPYLDSKMIAALIHDQYMTDTLERAIGAEHLATLRRVVPETFALSLIRGRYPEFLKAMEQPDVRSDWIIKGTDVETDTSWGCRGVMMGRKFGPAPFLRAASEGGAHGNKNVGVEPTLQRFHQSRDFRDLWDGIVDGSVRGSPCNLFGNETDKKITSAPATAAVYARVRPYILLDMTGETEAFVPPYAGVTLRADELSHGASDALFCAAKLI